MNKKKQDLRIEYLLTSASKYAEEGMIRQALGSIEDVKRRCYAINITVPADELKQIEGLAYKRNAEFLWRKVEIHIRSGFIDLGLSYIERIRRYKKRASIDISEEKLEEVERQAYKEGVKAAVEAAERYLREGMVGAALREIINAQEYVKKSGIDLPASLHHFNNFMNMNDIITAQKFSSYYSKYSTYLNPYTLNTFINHLYSALKEDKKENKSSR